MTRTAPASGEMVFTHCRMILPNSEMDGTLVVRDGRLSDIQPDRARQSGESWDGDYLLPGLIDLHADALESNLSPRGGVAWPIASAVAWHDRIMIAAGITTAGTTLSLRTVPRRAEFGAVLSTIEQVSEAFDAAERHGSLLADHFLHLRCELSPDASAVGLLQARIDDARIGLVSMMDHAPGQRQFLDPKAFRDYYGRRYAMTEPELVEYERLLTDRDVDAVARSRAEIVALARSRGIALASHDDATNEHVREGLLDGVAVSEFPTTASAARAAHESGIAVLMGAPNIVLNRSHTGNLSARHAAESGWLDILSSDYAPQSLLEALFLLAEHLGAPLHQTVGLATRAPASRLARCANDRGSLVVGQRADLLIVRHKPPQPPQIRAVYVAGQRVG